MIAAAKRNAHATSDLAKLKQVYLAICLYEGDQNEISPTTLVETFHYVKEPDIFRASVDKLRKIESPSGSYTSTPFVPCTGQPKSIWRISWAYLKTYPPHMEEQQWASLRNSAEVGILASPWSGWLSGRQPSQALTFGCGENVFEVSGPQFDGPILRIKMDGSLYTLPRHYDGLYGSLNDFFYRTK